MRIGVNCFLLRPEIGGIKQYFFQLFRFLRERNDEHSFLFFHSQENREELEKLGDLRADELFLLSRQREIKKYQSEMDVYFCPFGSLYPRPLPIPTVVTLVDIQEVFFPEFFTTKELVSRRFHYGGSTEMADRIITISDFSRRSIERHHGVEREKIIVSHLCADDKFYEPEKFSQPIHQEIPEQYIFFPANHWHHKNHDLLLRALAYLKREKNTTVSLVLTGYEQKGGYDVLGKAGEYTIEDQVTLLGYVSVNELIYLYSHATCLVFPSLFEGFGIPLVEAMASGCPVLAANSTSLPEVGGVGAIYFDPQSEKDLASKIYMLLGDNDQFEELKNRGKIRAQDFSPEKMSSIHLEAFSEAVSSFEYRRYLFNKAIVAPKHYGRFISSMLTGISHD